MGLAILFFLWFRRVLFLGGSSPPLTLYHTSCQVSRSNLCSAIFLYLISGCHLNFGSRGTNLIGRHQRSWELELRGAHAPPNPPILLLYHKELRLVKCFSKKIFFFFFIYISPFIISYFGFVCQVFFKNFFKKIFQIFLDFDGEM